VGTFVLNAGLRHPAVLAQDLATLDALSGGRVEIGLGAGWNKPEHDAIGIPFEQAGVRVKRLAEAIAVLKGCFAEGPFSFSGEHYTITGGPMVVTGHPRAEARRRADRIREQTGVELTIEEILDSPHVFIGSIKDLTRKFADPRERFGISSFLIDDLDALAPVVQELAG
jgi:hypothetical protein